jgi:hypothetical protein
MKNEIHEAIRPDIEVVVRTGNGELAVIGMFKADDSSWDVVVGLVDDQERDGVVAALELAVTAVSSASLVEPRVVGRTEEGGPPF